MTFGVLLALVALGALGGVLALTMVMAVGLVTFILLAPVWLPVSAIIGRSSRRYR